MEMYLRTKDYSINDDQGNSYSIEEAKEQYEHICTVGYGFNCNLAFQRLINEEFNLQAVKDYYAEDDIELIIEASDE